MRLEVESLGHVAPAVDPVFVSEGERAVSLCDDSFHDLPFESGDWLRSGCELDSILLDQVVDQTLASGNSELAIGGETPGIDLTSHRDNQIVMVTCCDLLNSVNRVQEEHRNWLCREGDCLASDGVLVALQEAQSFRASRTNGVR